MKRIAWILAAVAAGRRCALRAARGAGAARGAEGADRRADRQLDRPRRVAPRRAGDRLLSALSVTLNDVHVGGPDGMDDAEIMSMDRLDRHDPPAAARHRPDRGRLLHAWCARWSGWCATTRAVATGTSIPARRRCSSLSPATCRSAISSSRAAPSSTKTARPATASGSIRSTLAIDWPSVRQPLAIDGLGNLARRAGYRFGRSAAAPFAFLNGGATPLEARIEVGADRRRSSAARRTTIQRRN